MTSPGAGDRVVIDPEELRRVATKMRGGAEMLSSAGRRLATRPRPEMPAGLETHVAEIVQNANRELQELSLELLSVAAELSVRATQAELGEIDQVAWLMPGVHGLVSLFGGGAGTLSTTGWFVEPSLQSEDWAESALQRMDPGEPSDQTFAPAGLADVLQRSPDDLAAMPTGLMLEPEPGSAGDSAPETGAARGALGIAFEISDLGPTGIGLVGCLLAGGAHGSGDLEGAGP